jgi:hypothetical protein
MLICPIQNVVSVDRTIESSGLRGANGLFHCAGGNRKKRIDDGIVVGSQSRKGQAVARPAARISDINE